jgi:hypothetical protein
MIILVAPPTWGTTETEDTALSSFFPDILFIQGRVEDTPISDDKPIVLGEEPPLCEACQHQNRRLSIRCHHEAGERYPVHPVSRDEASEAGETLDDRSFRERHNSRHRDHRHAQEHERE